MNKNDTRELILNMVNFYSLFLERFNVLSNEEISELSQSLLKVQHLIIKMRDSHEDKAQLKNLINEQNNFIV